MEILLIAGLWLDGSAGDKVVPRLASLGHRAIPLTLPGQGDGSISATIDDQVAAIVAAVDATAGGPVVVEHSAASTLAWIAADARPTKVGEVALIGGFPSADGELYADAFESKDGIVPFPGWHAFEGPDSDDLDEGTKRRIASAAISVPEAVAKGAVHLSDVRRFDVPVTLICPEFSVAQAREWVEGGEVPELSTARHVDYVDIESGHWPMFSRPTELATLLAEVANA
jgi:pimeloyl-ACP methyl ester carboxylesterase